MAKLTNSFVGYIQRSAAQILDTCLVKLGARVPEMSDHSPSNPYVRNLEQFAGIHEQLHYYVDNAARETTLAARLYSSLVNKAREHNYQIIGSSPYTTDLQFILSDYAPVSINIPVGTTVSNESGTIVYRTTTTGTIINGQKVSNIVAAEQSEVVINVAKGVSLGGPDLEITFAERIVHNSVVARWDGIAWNRKDSLAYSDASALDFVQTVDPQGRAVVYFGNELPAGKVPISGQSLEVDYLVTLGSLGKVGKGEITKVVTVVPGIPNGYSITAINLEQSVGGADPEGLEELRRHIPLANRTLGRAVTQSDFKAVVELAPSIATAGVSYNGRRDINIYIVPTGGGIASTGLISSTQAYINARKVIGTNPVIKAAGESHVRLKITINVNPSYPRLATEAKVLANLYSFLSFENQKVNGTSYISDLYQIIEGTEGVDNSVISIFSIAPYARPANGLTPPLVWTVTLTANTSPTQAWRIFFDSGTSYKLLKGATLVGTYSTGATVTMPEFQFTIPAGVYSSGNIYDFYTYPYNSSEIVLLEPSLPVAVAGDIALTSSGGY